MLLFKMQFIVMEGGALTAEAREPSRRRRLHYQLQLARRLRAQMEQAADQAEAAGSVQEARSIIVSNTRHINELVSLTEAVRGGYTLDSYQEDWGFQQAEQEQARQVEVARIQIRNQLRSMHQQRSRDAASRDAAMRSVPRPAAAAAYSPPAAHVPERVESSLSLFPGGGRSAQKRPAKDSSPVSPPNRSPLSVNDATRLTEGSSLSPRFPPPDKRSRTNEAMIPSPMQESPTNAASSSSKVASKPPTTTAPKPAAGHNKAPLRKCHYCKVATTRFRRCHFWFANGTKCGKTFCKVCLMTTYAESSSDWDTTLGDSDWQ